MIYSFPATIPGTVDPFTALRRRLRIAGYHEMKPAIGKRLRNVLISGLIAFSAANAQTPPFQQNGASAEREQRLAWERDQIANARAFVRNDNFGAAEKVMATLNHAKPSTAASLLETAQRLMHLAHDVGREGRPDRGRVLGARALQLLEQAEALARNSRQRAAIMSVAGFVHERLLGDLPSAEASYRSAAQLNPQAKDIAEHLARLEAAKEHLARGTGSK